MSNAKPFPCSYFFSTPDEIVECVDRAEEVLADVDFDTLVGTGLSGSLALPMLAARMGKNFVIIRKDSDDSHHGGGRLVGTLGARWIFFDDFVSSGATKSRVRNKVEDGCRPSVWDQNQTPHATEYVGDYLYGVWISENDADVRGSFMTAADASNGFGA